MMFSPLTDASKSYAFCATIENAGEKCLTSEQTGAILAEWLPANGHSEALCKPGSGNMNGISTSLQN